MRKNLPVTEVENAVHDEDVLISRTDAKGRITFVSTDFCRISEFDPEEMVGKPHNLIRHPDVPPALFADLWATIQGGRPWSGIVKNRARSGNYYWVEANVTPLMRSGQIVGYLSVRRKPTAQQKDEAKPMYARLSAGSLPGRISDRLLAWNRRLSVRVAGLLALLVLPLLQPVSVAAQAGNLVGVLVPVGMASASCVLAILLMRGIISAARAASETARVVSVGDLSRAPTGQAAIAEMAEVKFPCLPRNRAIHKRRARFSGLPRCWLGLTVCRGSLRGRLGV